MSKLNEIIKSYAKKFSKEEIYVASELQKINEQVVSTGILTLDLATGIGGIPMGKILEIYGQESSGKTSLSLIITSQVQKAGKISAFIDAESTFDPQWAASLGVNIDELLVVTANSLEDSLEKLQFLLLNGVEFVVYDSIAAPPTEAQNAGDFGDATIGVRARVLSSALSKLLPIIRENKATIIFLNQLREKIGVYGNPETTPGGRALKFYSSLRFNMRKKVLKENEEVIGDEVTIVVEKNKFAPPMKKAKFILFYDGTYTIDYVDILQRLGLLEKAGAWYTELITGEKHHGAQALLEKINKNKEYKEKIDGEIRSRIYSSNVLEESKDDSE